MKVQDFGAGVKITTILEMCTTLSVVASTTVAVHFFRNQLQKAPREADDKFDMWDFKSLKVKFLFVFTFICVWHALRQVLCQTTSKVLHLIAA